MHFQNDLSQINKAQQNQFTTYITPQQEQLKEQRISPHDLIEIDAEEYKEMKNQGLSLDQMKEKIHQVQDKQDLDFNFKFKAPKKENYSKKGVFLPKKGERYNNLSGNSQQPQQQFIQKQTYVQSYQPQPQYQQNIRTVQTSIPQQTYVHSKQPVVVKRIYKDQYGNVINEETVQRQQ